jgi:hypothetical protein
MEGNKNYKVVFTGFSFEDLKLLFSVRVSVCFWCFYVSGCVILLNGFAIFFFFLGKNGSAVCSVILPFFWLFGRVSFGVFMFSF